MSIWVDFTCKGCGTVLSVPKWDDGACKTCGAEYTFDGARFQGRIGSLENPVTGKDVIFDDSEIDFSKFNQRDASIYYRQILDNQNCYTDREIARAKKWFEFMEVTNA